MCRSAIGTKCLLLPKTIHVPRKYLCKIWSVRQTEGTLVRYSQDEYFIVLGLQLYILKRTYDRIFADVIVYIIFVTYMA